MYVGRYITVVRNASLAVEPVPVPVIEIDAEADDEVEPEESEELMMDRLLEEFEEPETLLGAEVGDRNLDESEIESDDEF